MTSRTSDSSILLSCSSLPLPQARIGTRSCMNAPELHIPLNLALKELIVDHILLNHCSCCSFFATLISCLTCLFLLLSSNSRRTMTIQIKVTWIDLPKILLSSIKSGRNSLRQDITASISRNPNSLISSNVLENLATSNHPLALLMTSKSKSKRELYSEWLSEPIMVSFTLMSSSSDA